jgi:hypothetical protein
MTELSLAVTLLLAAAPGWAMPRKPRLDKSMETEGSHCKVSEPGHRVVETPRQWAELWSDIGKPAPRVDLSKQVAVAVFAGLRNTGGFSIDFEPPKLAGDTMTVRYKIVKPKGMAIMALTQPYAIKMFPRDAKKILVEGREE